MFGRNGAITHFLQSPCQFISINCRAVANGLEHRPVLQRLPTLLPFIERGVEHGEMRVQQRVQCARTVMHKGCRNQIAGGSVLLAALLPDARGRESFEFAERNLG